MNDVGFNKLRPVDRRLKQQRRLTSFKDLELQVAGYLKPHLSSAVAAFRPDLY
jgi:hypothetical protein